MHPVTHVDPVDTAIALVLAVLLIAAVLYGIYCAVSLLSPVKPRTSKKPRSGAAASPMTDEEAQQLASQTTLIAVTAAAASTTIMH